MAENEIFNFFGADFFAAAVDQIFLAPFDHVIPRRMAAHEVAGTVKAIGGKSSGIVFRHAKIAAQSIRPAGEKFADLAGHHFVVVVIDQPDFIVRAHRSSNGFHPDLFGIVEADEHQHAFGHTEIFLYRDARNQLLSSAADFGLEPLAAALDHAQR